MSRRRAPLQTEEEIEVTYWQQRVFAAVAALDAATNDLLESRPRYRAALNKLAASRRPAPAPIVALPIRINPAWSRGEEAS